MSGDRRTSRRTHGERARADEALDPVVGRIAHDLNNLLAVSRTFAEIVADELADRPDLRSHLDEVVKAADAGGRLTRRLSALGGDRPPRSGPVDLRAFMAAVEPALRLRAGPGVELRIGRPARPAVVEADLPALERAVDELLSTALAALPGARELVATVDVVTADGETPASTPAGRVRLRLHGDAAPGSGVDPPAVAQRCFDRALTAVAALGGDLSLRPGVELTCLLPAATPEARLPAAPQDPPRRVAGGRRTVMVVDDDRGMRASITILLRDAGYRVEAFASPDDALAWNGDADLLVTDLVMPGMSGVALARLLRARKPELGLLFVSAQAAQQALPGPSLAKPFSSRGLLEAVRASLRPQ